MSVTVYMKIVNDKGEIQKIHQMVSGSKQEMKIVEKALDEGLKLEPSCKDEFDDFNRKEEAYEFQL